MAITPQERVGNIGYLGLAPETAPGVPAIPTDWTLLEEETLTTNYQLQEQTPIFGSPFATFRVLPGMRTHKGDFTIVAEPNTLTYVMDGLLTRGSVTGSGPYAWPFTLTANPTKSYTVDISTGNFVKRFCGVMASKVAPNWNKNELQVKVTVSALYSFLGAQIASVSGSGPYTVVFDTAYSATPTAGLVINDLIRFYNQDGTSYTDAVIDTVVDGTSITTSTDVSTFATGDFMYLRPATPSLNLLDTFLWSNTQFKFGANLTAAAAANQTRVEQGSTWEIDNNFESDDGSDRSGSADPASLIRTTGNVSLSVKKFFDQPDDVQLYKQLEQTACIVTHYAGSGNQYKFIIKYPSLTTDDPLPQLKAASVNYSTINLIPAYDTASAGGFSVEIDNGLASIA